MAVTAQTPPDLAWHLHIACGMLEGKMVYRDFFEINTPFIIYLTYVSVAISHLLKIDYQLGLSIFNSCLVVYCWYMCTRRLSTYYNIATISLLSGVVVIFPFIFPISEFGQKEHLFIALFMALLLESIFFPQRQSSIQAILMAGFGMMIKPFFILLYLPIILTRFHIREVCIIAGMQMTYYILIYLYHPEYFAFIVPVAYPAYGMLNVWGWDMWSNIKLGVSQILLNVWGVILPLLMAIPFFTRLELNLVKFLMVGLLMAKIQGKFFWYHFIPALSIGWLAIGFLMQNIMQIWRKYYEGDTSLYCRHHFGIVVAIVVLGVLVIQVMMIGDRLEQRYFDKVGLEEIRTLMANHKGSEVILLGPHISPTLMLPQKFGLKWPMKQHSLQILDGIFASEDCTKKHQHSALLEYVVNDVVTAMRSGPKVVLIQENMGNLGARSLNFFLVNHHDYLAFMQEHSLEFTKLWHHYKSCGSIGNNFIKYRVFMKECCSE